MSSAPGRLSSAEALLERRDGRRDVVERERRLGDDGDGLALGIELGGVLGRLDDEDLLRTLALRPDHLHVVGMADERDDVARVRIPARLGVHLRDERADGVDDTQAACRAVLTDGRRDAVRREHADLARRDVVLGVDEDRAQRLEPAHDVVVVDDLVPDVDRGPVRFEEPLDDLDGAIDAGAERPRRREQHPLHVAHLAPARVSASSARLPSAPARLTPSGARANAFTSPPHA